MPKAVTARHLLGVMRQRFRRQIVARRVPEVARAVLGAGQDRRGAHRLGHVVMGAQEQRLDPARVFLVLVALEPVGVQHRTVNQSLDDLVGHVMGDLPAQRGGAELAGSAMRHSGGYARPLAVEGAAITQPDQDDALAVGVRDGEAFELPAGFAGIQQPGQRSPG